MPSISREIFDGMIDLLYPPICLVCRSESVRSLCANCCRSVEALQPPFCDRCGVPAEGGAKVCNSCEVQEPPFDWTHSLGKYKGSLERAIHLLKYEGKTALSKPLGEMLAESLLQDMRLVGASASGILAFDRIVPVPLHPARQRERGFNQSDLLANAISERTGWRVDVAGLRRAKKTRIQARLNHIERLSNVAGAFETSKSLYFKDERILLVDDVLTTSSTLRECARVLKNGGASRVCVAVLARG